MLRTGVLCKPPRPPSRVLLAPAPIMATLPAPPAVHEAGAPPRAGSDVVGGGTEDAAAAAAVVVEDVTGGAGKDGV